MGPPDTRFAFGLSRWSQTHLFIAVCSAGLAEGLQSVVPEGSPSRSEPLACGDAQTLLSSVLQPGLKLPSAHEPQVGSEGRGAPPCFLTVCP